MEQPKRLKRRTQLLSRTVMTYLVYVPIRAVHISLTLVQLLVPLQVNLTVAGVLASRVVAQRSGRGTAIRAMQGAGFEITAIT
jgi:ribosomal protein S11